MSGTVFTIGGWTFDPREPVLRRGDVEKKLEDRAARTLAVMCHRRGEVVSRTELLDAVWNGRQVSANSVAIVIGSLRRALDDDPRDPVHLRTIARRGYRLAGAEAQAQAQAQAQAPVDPPASPPPEATTNRPPSRPRRLTWLVAGAGASATVVAMLVVLLLPHPTDLRVDAPSNETGRPDYDTLTHALAPVVVDAAARLRGVRVTIGVREAGSHVGVVLGARLILWNGAPEVALTATDMRHGTVFWTGFAAGPPALLARHVTARIATLQADLSR